MSELQIFAKFCSHTLLSYLKVQRWQKLCKVVKTVMKLPGNLEGGKL